MDDERDGYSFEDLTESYSTSFEEGAVCTCDEPVLGSNTCGACNA